MKHKVNFLLLSSLASLGCIGASRPTTEYGIVSIKAAPLYVDGGTSQIILNVNASSTYKVSVQAKIINDLYPNGISIYTKSFTSVSSATIKYDNSYTRPSGNKIKFIQTVNKSEKIITCDSELANGQSVILDESIFNYESKSAFYTWNISGKTWIPNTEKLSFYNFEDSYIPNYYHNIDLSNFYIEIEESISTSSLQLESATFSITNKDGIFDSFTHDSSDIYIPLSLTKKSSKFMLSFKDNLYVNPTTLEMSSYKTSENVKTNRFYLPRNEKRFEEDYLCRIVLSGLGQDKSDFYVQFKYKSLLNTFGDCHNSEYCIVNS